MVSENLVVFTARSGSPSLKVNGTPYYNEYDPEREVRRFCSNLPIENADVILLFGWGLGYSGSVVRARMKPRARVIVFEPDAAEVVKAIEEELAKDAPKVAMK